MTDLMIAASVVFFFLCLFMAWWIKHRPEYKEIVPVRVASYDDASNTQGTIMRNVELSQADFDQVRAIMMTHVDMQDLRSVESMSLLGRMRQARDDGDDSDDMRNMIDDLSEQINTFEGDTDNLRRIADIFQ